MSTEAAAPRSYSPFWAVFIFLVAVLAMDLQQSVKLHRQKLALMQQDDQLLKAQKQVAAQLKWVKPMRNDLLQLAPGDPEAAQIVADLHLAPTGR